MSEGYNDWKATAAYVLVNDTEIIYKDPVKGTWTWTRLSYEDSKTGFPTPEDAMAWRDTAREQELL